MGAPLRAAGPGSHPAAETMAAEGGPRAAESPAAAAAQRRRGEAAHGLRLLVLGGLRQAFAPNGELGFTRFASDQLACI